MERLASPAGAWYYHFDALGSVTDLSNASGQQAEHYYYMPFGKTKIYNASGVKLADSAYGNYYRFTARQWDAESNLYYYRARMYDPNLGRFLQADPVGYSADINLYRYCGNNGVNRIDPLGLDDDSPNKRPDETWDDYWARKRAAQAKKFGDQRTKRAQGLLNQGMAGAALRALGYRGPLASTGNPAIDLFHKAIGLDITGKEFNDLMYWAAFANGVIENIEEVLVGAIGPQLILPPPYGQIIAATITLCIGSELAVEAYKEAWVPQPERPWE